MVFLNPAVLFGLLAASIPVIIHLLNLRKLKRVEFSTLAFLKELQKTKIRRIKLKQWILLALRTLIILLLVAAFARPTIKSVAIGGTTSAAKTSAVIILDDTYSMSIVTDEGSYFNQSKQVIKTLLNEFTQGDDITIISVSSTNDMETSSNIDKLREDIGSLEIAATSGTLHNALVKAGQALSESQNFNKEIYILSDFQNNRLYENETELSDLGQLFPEGIRLYTFDMHGKDAVNLAVTGLRINNQIFEKNKLISLTASIENTSESNVRSTVASLFINGSRSAQQSVSLAPGETQNITFETTLRETGLLNILVELEDDDIARDNRRYNALLVPDVINIALFTNAANDTRFLELALANSRAEGNIRITQKRLTQLNATNLNAYNTVILCGSPSESELTNLQDYVEAGGGSILMPSSDANLGRFNTVLSSFNIPTAETFIGGKGETESPAVFDEIDFNHPVFGNLFEDEEKRFESPGIYYYLKQSTRGTGTEIISLIDGTTFLSEYKYGSGKVMLLNTSPVLSWSNFPLKGIFAPLMNKTVNYLSSTNAADNHYIAGSEIPVKLNRGSVPQVKVKGPDGGEDILNIDTLGAGGYVRYGETNGTGLYEFYSGNELIDYAVVNTNPAESRIGYAETEDYENYLSEINFRGTHIQAQPDGNFTDLIYQARFGSELWRYFLIFAFVLAVIEMIVARNAKKDLAQVNS